MGNKHWRQDRNTSTAPKRVQRQVHSPDMAVDIPDTDSKDNTD